MHVDGDLQSLVRKRLDHKEVLQVFLLPGVGRVLATHLGYAGLYALFGDEMFHVLSDICRDYPYQNPVLVAGDLLEELLVDWFLGLSRGQLSDMLPRSRLMKLFKTPDETQVLAPLLPESKQMKIFGPPEEPEMPLKLRKEDKWITDLLVE